MHAWDYEFNVTLKSATFLYNGKKLNLVWFSLFLCINNQT